MLLKYISPKRNNFGSEGYKNTRITGITLTSNNLKNYSHNLPSYGIRNDNNINY